MRILDQSIPNMQFTRTGRCTIIVSVSNTIPCVLMRAGTSRGPFFLREWLPEDDTAKAVPAYSSRNFRAPGCTGKGM